MNYLELYFPDLLSLAFKIYNIIVYANGMPIFSSLLPVRDLIHSNFPTRVNQQHVRREASTMAIIA